MIRQRLSLWMHKNLGTPCFYDEGIEATSPSGEVAFHVCEGCEEVTFIVRGEAIAIAPMDEFMEAIDRVIGNLDITHPEAAAEFLALKFAVEDSDD